MKGIKSQIVTFSLRKLKEKPKEILLSMFKWLGALVDYRTHKLQLSYKVMELDGMEYMQNKKGCVTIYNNKLYSGECGKFLYEYYQIL